MKTSLIRWPHLAGLFVLAASPLAFGQDAERSPIYPFDVKVGGELAVIDGSPATAIFARTGKAVKNDAWIELATEPGLLIVNVFPCDQDGELAPAAQAKVIMATAATKVQLNQTMDKSVLEPGFYLMNVVMAAKGTSRVVFEIGDGTKKAVPASVSAPAPVAAAGGVVDQSTPGSVLQAVFDCAVSGELGKLASLKSSTADGDVKRVCDVGEAPAEGQKEFVSYFAKGRIVGEARVDGDKAAIEFKFGPDGTRDETMKLVREKGKWFLDGF